MSFLAPKQEAAQPQAPAPPVASPPPPMFGQQTPTKAQKKGSAQPTVVGSAPGPENLGSKTLIGQ